MSLLGCRGAGHEKRKRCPRIAEKNTDGSEEKPFFVRQNGAGWENISEKEDTKSRCATGCEISQKKNNMGRERSSRGPGRASLCTIRQPNTQEKGFEGVPKLKPRSRGGVSRQRIFTMTGKGHTRRGRTTSMRRGDGQGEPSASSRQHKMLRTCAR